MRRILWAALVVFSGSLATAAEVTLDDYAPPAAGQVKILRDRFGVPHVIAADEWSLLYGAGYAQAEDQLENLAINLLRGQGRAAEREGFPQLIFDHLMRLFEIPRRSREAYAALPEDERRPLDAFCAGVNAYLATHRDQAPDWIQSVSADQVLSFAMYVDALFCVSHCRDDLATVGIKIGALEALPNPREITFGSNQFAIAPGRSATGAALLSMDPHLPHSGFFRWYEMHLVGPGINVMGACFYGSPYVSMGRTPHSAWCMTVNAPDLGDVFVFDINPENPAQYRGLNGWQEFEESEEVYLLSGPKGMVERKQTARRTEIGPVMTERDGKAYVFALPLAASSGRVRQLDRMARAKNVDEFRESLKTLGLPMFNIVYADTAGDIFYVSNGRVPRRDVRIDSHQPRPGHEAWARWQGFHTLDELPQVRNPNSGYLLNTNSGPQNVTPEGAPRPDQFLPYQMGQQANSRWRRLAELLAADASISWEDMHVYAVDTRLEAGQQHAGELVQLLRASAQGDSSAEVAARKVADVLEPWNFRTDLDSRGAALFVHLWLDDELVQAVRSADGAKAVQRAAAVSSDFLEVFGTLDAPWSEFSRVRRGEIEMGVAGCGVHKTKGGRETIGAALRPSGGPIQEGRRYLASGSSYGMIVDFSGETQAISCLPYGISADPRSPHFADQLPLYVAGKFKPAWFFPSELVANQESVVTLTTAP